jgi:hypothetical protein
MDVSGQLHAPTALTPGKEPPLPIGHSLYVKFHNIYLGYSDLYFEYALHNYKYSRRYVKLLMSFLHEVHKMSE